MKKIIFSLLFIFMFSLAFVSAECSEYGTYKQSFSINLIQTCTTCSGINASIVYPDGTQTGSFAFQNINNVYNYTFTNTTQLGTYNVIGLDAWCYSFEVTTNELTSTDIAGQIRFAILIFIGLIIAIIVFKWVSKLFGSMLIFAIGLGMLRADAQNGWIGLIVMLSGFLMLIYALIEQPKKRY